MTERIPYEKPRLLEPAMTKLLPCPFCGGRAHHYSRQQTWTNTDCVICEGCGATLVRNERAKDEIAAWNRRAE